MTRVGLLDRARQALNFDNDALAQHRLHICKNASALGAALMLPFVLSIIALIVMSRRVAYPRALMVPYRKGER